MTDLGEGASGEGAGGGGQVGGGARYRRGGGGGIWIGRNLEWRNLVRAKFGANS